MVCLNQRFVTGQNPSFHPLTSLSVLQLIVTPPSSSCTQSLLPPLSVRPAVPEPRQTTPSRHGTGECSGHVDMHAGTNWTGKGDQGVYLCPTIILPYTLFMHSAQLYLTAYIHTYMNLSKYMQKSTKKKEVNCMWRIRVSIPASLTCYTTTSYYH